MLYFSLKFEKAGACSSHSNWRSLLSNWSLNITSASMGIKLQSKSWQTDQPRRTDRQADRERQNRRRPKKKLLPEICVLSEYKWFNRTFANRIIIWTETYTSALIGTWKCNFPPLKEIMTDRRTARSTNRPKDGHKGSSGSYTSKNR